MTPPAFSVAPPFTIDREVALERMTFVLIAALCFFCFWARDITYFDEPRYVGIAKETATSGSWVLPQLYGQPYTEKPPLWYWCVGLLGKTFGWNSFSFFLPNVLAHFLTALLVFDLGRRTMSRRAGVIAALVYAACPLVLRNARSAQLDLMLVFGETLTAWGAICALQTRKLGFGLLAAVGFGVGSMVKGHIALFGVLAPLAWCFARRDWSFLRRPWWIVLSILALIPLGMWIFALTHELGWSEVKRLYWERQILERTAGKGDHYSPWPIGPEYVAALATMLPMVLFVPAIIRGRPRSHATFAFLLWAVAYFVIFALTPTKREIYMMPLAVPLALLVGERIAAFRAGIVMPTKLEVTGSAVLGGLFVLVGIGLPVYALVKGQLGFAAICAGVVGLFAAAPALRHLRRPSVEAPLFAFLLLATLAVFAEPALGRLANARFGERDFGLRVKDTVPADSPVFVVNISKPHALRYFSERDLVFVDQPEQLSTAIAGRQPAYVVARGKDVKELTNLGYTFEVATVETNKTKAKAQSLLKIPGKS